MALCAKSCGTGLIATAAACTAGIAGSWDEPDLRFVHLRPMGSSQQSIYTGRMRHGSGQYFMGTGFVFMTASAVSRLNQKPYVLGSMAMLWGWLKSSAMQRKPRYGDAEFRRFLRQYHWRVLLVGKSAPRDAVGSRFLNHVSEHFTIRSGLPT